MENNLHEDGFIAQKAIIIYKNSKSHYIETHRIKNDVFLEGVPLEKKDLKVFNILSQEHKKSTELLCFPYRLILGLSNDLVSTEVTWIYPAGINMILYDSSIRGIKTGDYYVPNLVFQLKGTELNVYAIKQKDITKINEYTKLYNAPFFNIDSGGKVCMGNAYIEEGDSLSETIRNVERAFFGSTFTHPNNKRILKKSFASAYKKQNKKFDELLLIECCKLNEIW